MTDERQDGFISFIISLRHLIILPCHCTKHHCKLRARKRSWPAMSIMPKPLVINIKLGRDSGRFPRSSSTTRMARKICILIFQVGCIPSQPRVLTNRSRPETSIWWLLYFRKVYNLVWHISFHFICLTLIILFHLTEIKWYYHFIWKVKWQG